MEGEWKGRGWKRQGRGNGRGRGEEGGRGDVSLLQERIKGPG